jgi:hypothetical protein
MCQTPDKVEGTASEQNISKEHTTIADRQVTSLGAGCCLPQQQRRHAAAFQHMPGQHICLGMLHQYAEARI